MKQITLNIPDSKFTFFMQLVDSLSFIKVVDKESLEDQLTPAQKKTWHSIKTGFQEMKELEKNGLKGRSVEELLAEMGVE